LANGIWGGAPNSYPSGSYNAVEMVDNMNGWAAGHATIIHTTDGVNWTEQSVPSGIVGELYDLHFLNLNEGWVVGAGQGVGKILHTSNGGQSWVFEAEGLIDDHLLAVNFTSPTNGYAVGLNSMLLKYSEVSGIDENSHSFAFDLFPNPADESVRINCSEFNTESGSIEILSAEGKTLQKKTVGKGNTDIEMDLKNLDAGMYMCRITIGNKRASRKLIIE
jgi:hypothetical protein